MVPSFKQRQRMNQYNSKIDFLVITYDSIKSRVNGHGRSRYKGLELIERNEFYRWALLQPEFHELYGEWLEQAGKKPYRPSVDRIDNNGGYTKANMRWLSIRENSRLGALISTAMLQNKRR